MSRFQVHFKMTEIYRGDELPPSYDIECLRCGDGFPVRNLDVLRDALDQHYLTTACAPVPFRRTRNWIARYGLINLYAVAIFLLSLWYHLEHS